MSLVLEIEFLTGVCRAAQSPASDAPDWPPQPDRVFSGLVSAWAARGQRSIERQALEWLEDQRPPQIHAGGHTARTAPDVFVPPNDQRASTAAATYLKIMPWSRPRQPRRFPVAWLDDPVLTLVWSDEPASELLAALDALARDVGYLGHSASLVRCRFLARNAPASRHAAAPALRQIYPGRLQELQRAYRANPARPMILPGATVLPEPAAPPARGPDWLVLKVVGGSVPDLRAAAPIGRILRRALMSGYRGIGMANEIPEVVSGHAPDGRPTRAPHLAIAPLAFVGYRHADSQMFGFALIPVAHLALRDIPGLRPAFENVASYDRVHRQHVLEIRGEPLRGGLYLSPAGAASKRSLDPAPYLQHARCWASVTPIVLDRHLKRYDEGRVRELIADSCANVGLPRPDPERIQVGKHSAVEGAPPAWPRPGAPPWTAWRVPPALASRSLTHAVIDFGREVAGPVLLGAGRFTGLGLCRRLGYR